MKYHFFDLVLPTLKAFDLGLKLSFYLDNDFWFGLGLRLRLDNWSGLNWNHRAWHWSRCCLYFVLDPLELELEYTYNLNVVKEVKVTDSFLTLPEDDKQCQDEYTWLDCRTNKYLNSLLENCKCLPLNLRLKEQVFHNTYLYKLF